MIKLYFKYRRDAHHVAKKQKCNVRIYYDKEIKSYRLVLFAKASIFGLKHPDTEEFDNYWYWEMYDYYSHLIKKLFELRMMHGEIYYKKNIKKVVKKLFELRKEFEE